jgi:hypothetical protein
MVVQWDQGPIKGLGWSEDEKLLAVTEDGTVRVYEGLQTDFVPFSLGHVSAILPYVESFLMLVHRAQRNMESSPADSGLLALSPSSRITT